MKVLVLIIDSDDQPVYEYCRNVLRSYMNLRKDVFDCFFIRGDPNISSSYQVDESKNLMVAKCRDSLVPGVLIKSILCLGYLYEPGKNYDYVIRTNLSTFWIWDRILKFIEDLPRTQAYIGVVNNINGVYASGAGFIMSQDIAKDLYNNRDSINMNEHSDDVVIGRFFAKRGVKLVPFKRFELLSHIRPSVEEIKAIADNPEAHHIRVKSFGDRVSVDSYVFSILLQHVYHQQIDNLLIKYNSVKNTRSDINEHIKTFHDYVVNHKCYHVTEFCVRSIVSSYGFAKGLSELQGDKTLVGVDLNDHPNIQVLRDDCQQAGINYKFIRGDSTKVDIDQTDILFIDTWHVYGHLKRELARHHSKVRKFIMMHDTTIDEVYGESIRLRWDTNHQSKASGYPEEEIRKGLGPAISEFLNDHQEEWVLDKKFTNNNGLTILKRVKLLVRD